jgi:hypothetical protein
MRLLKVILGGNNMAYKFQLGAAKLSGSITQTDGTATFLGLDNSDQSVTNVNDIAVVSISADNSSEVVSNNNFRLSGSSALQFGSSNVAISQNTNDVQFEVPSLNKISFVNGPSASFDIESANLTAYNDLKMDSTAKVLLGDPNAAIGGDGSGALQLESDGAQSIQLVVGADPRIVADSTGLQLSGAVATNSTLTVNGLLTGNNGIALNDVSGILDGAGGLEDASGEIRIASAGVTNAMLSGSITAEKLSTGAGLTDNAGALEVSVDDSSIEAAGGTLNVKAGGITNAMLSGSITAEKLQLGNGLEDNAGNVQINLDGASSGLALSGDGIALASTIPSDRTFSANVTIGGNLTVQGSTTTVDSTTINISSSFTFEGPVDAHQTILDAGTPVADTTVYLPELSAGTYYLPAFDADPSGTSLSVTPAELNLLDGDTSVGSTITIDDTDGFIINDGGTMKVIPASDIRDYAAAASALSVASKADGDTLATGMNYFANISTDASVTLPASPSVADLVYVKAGDIPDGKKITVSRAGSQTIDGETSILLESPYAAVTLIYVASNDWRIV